MLLAFCIIAPLAAHADTLGNNIINILYGPKGISGSQIDSITGVTADNGYGLMDIVQTLVGQGNPLAPFALSLVALFFVIETLNKSVSFEKITIEMVIKLLIRLLIAKILVDNASNILIQIDRIIIKSTGTVMQGITNSVAALKAKNPDIDAGWGVTNIVSLFSDSGLAWIMTSIGNVFGVVLTTIMTLGKGGMGALMEAAGWAALMAMSVTLNNFLGWGNTSLYNAQQLQAFGITTSGTNFAYVPIAPATWVYYIWLGMLLIRVVIAYLVEAIIWIQIYITLVLRSIEMLLLAYLAPIAMAAFVSDEFKATTKKFLLNFATICLQGMVIVVICKVIDIIFVDKLTLDNFLKITSPSSFPATNLAAIPSWLAPFITEKGLGYVMWAFAQLGIYDMWGNSWGFLNPLKMLLISIVPPIITSILIGKSRSIAQTLIGG